MPHIRTVLAWRLWCIVIYSNNCFLNKLKEMLHFSSSINRKSWIQKEIYTTNWKSWPVCHVPGVGSLDRSYFHSRSAVCLRVLGSSGGFNIPNSQTTCMAILQHCMAASHGLLPLNGPLLLKVYHSQDLCLG